MNMATNSFPRINIPVCEVCTYHKEWEPLVESSDEGEVPEDGAVLPAPLPGLCPPPTCTTSVPFDAEAAAAESPVP